MKKNVVIHLYIIELPEANIKQRAQDQGLTQNQPQAQSQAQNDNEPSLSEAGAWADNLIVSALTEKVIPSENSSKSQLKISSITTNRPNKLPIRRTRLRTAKQTITPLQIDEALHYCSTMSKSSYFLKATPLPNSTPTVKSPSPASPSKRMASHFDVEENLGQVNDEGNTHDDSEDSDFREWQLDGSEESQSFSLDKEDDLGPENESLDDINFENNTQLRMTLGHGSIDNDEHDSLSTVNKMAKVFKQGKLWTRNRDGKGIIKALKNVMPQALRRICVLYFYKNFASNYPRDDEPLEHWAGFKFDQTLKLNDNTNNFIESFNNTIVKHRGKPTYTMLEEIRKLVEDGFDKRFHMSTDWEGKVIPFVEKKLKQLELEFRNCRSFMMAQYTPFPTHASESAYPALDPPFELRKRRRPEKYKRRKNRLSIPQQLSTIQLSGTKRCKKCRQLGHNSLTCGQPRDENGRLKCKKKPQQKIGNPVSSPKKIQKVSQASTSTAAASGVPTQSSQAI
ncbi:LOW QUALITY PROTEIN: hypothetical protein Cgig2_009870 [Carnegiea gigantea]|uniref:Uncharacterized protein n=1 Tax=Carnegiea gigantea TaxID=171969 RepID=A0A9Q1KNF1_9CARY|nr:LOW QUALITY PROTEIN: hypothetical protein Cgig2_009870 [Carnegiea gigantea]